MQRRAYLAGLAAAGGLAGCLTGGASDADAASDDADDGDTAGSETTTTAGAAGTDRASPTGPIAARGRPADICERPVVDAGIYAVTDPSFGDDWSDVAVGREYRHDLDEGRLFDDQAVVGLETDGRARAYPLTALSVHEIVNDAFGGPVAVTYCPLCRSAVVAERRVAGQVTDFGVSGRLWTPDRVDFERSVDDGRVRGVNVDGETVQPTFSRALVMYDLATRSYWSQLLATAICGPATGSVLTIRPSTLTSWGAWRRDHPDTEVLLPPSESDLLTPGETEGYAPADGTTDATRTDPPPADAATTTGKPPVDAADDESR